MNKRIVLVAILLVAASGILAAPVLSKSENRNFVAHLSGKGEVPQVNTSAQGQAIFQLSKDGTMLH